MTPSPGGGASLLPPARLPHESQHVNDFHLQPASCRAASSGPVMHACTSRRAASLCKFHTYIYSGMSCIPQRHNDHAEKSGAGCERVEIMCISCSSEIVLSFGKYHVIISWGRYGFPAVSLFVAAFGRCAFGGRLFVFGGRGLGFLAVARVPSIIRTFWRVAEIRIKITFVGFVADPNPTQP